MTTRKARLTFLGSEPSDSEQMIGEVDSETSAAEATVFVVPEQLMLSSAEESLRALGVNSTSTRHVPDFPIQLFETLKSDELTSIESIVHDAAVTVRTFFS